jgi:hypothetical protein
VKHPVFVKKKPGKFPGLAAKPSLYLKKLLQLTNPCAKEYSQRLPSHNSIFETTIYCPHTKALSLTALRECS